MSTQIATLQGANVPSVFHSLMQQMQNSELSQNVGANYAIDTHWGVAFSLSWIPMKTTATLTTRVGGNTVGVARTRVRLDPIVPYLYLTYRF